MFAPAGPSIDTIRPEDARREPGVPYTGMFPWNLGITPNRGVYGKAVIHRLGDEGCPYIF